MVEADEGAPGLSKPAVADDQLLAWGRQVVQRELEALHQLGESLDHRFVTALGWITSTEGRVVVTGIGKSGAVARKSAATLASTGTPAFFLHPAEAVHGDLGMVTPGDVVVALSFSGETDEVLALLPALRRLGVRLIAVTSRRESTLASNSDLVLELPRVAEACPLNLAPTSSVVAMLAMLDALAVTAMQLREFSSDDFALLHPAGSLGRRLLLRVRDIMRTGKRMAICRSSESVRDVLFRITAAESGAAFVVAEDGVLEGVLTDGDIRRLLTDPQGNLEWLVERCMNRSPRSTTPDRLVTEALTVMESTPPCGELPVLDQDRRPVGVLNLKDVVRAGVG